MPSQIEQYLEKKRGAIERVDAKAAYEKIQSGEGVIIDTRPESFRVAEGAIPGAVIIERLVPFPE
jgi:rhodanese-related sulfurtransferase